MGNNKSHKSQAAFDSNQASCSSCESAETCSVMAAECQENKKTAKIAGGVASAAALGTGALAGGTAGTIAVVGTIVSITVGIPTLGVGLLVGLAATAGTAGAAAGIAGIGGAVATHFIAKHYEKDEATFKKVQGDFHTTAKPPQPQQPMHTVLDVSSTPTLKDIFQLVVTPVAAGWESVAICLDIEPCVTDIISKNNPKDCERACHDMLKRWLSKEHYTGDQERTWSTLLTALDKANFVDLEQRLRREHFTSQGT